MDTTTDAPTTEDFLGEVTTRLDKFCGADLSPTEYELWRALAGLTAALRAHLEQPHDHTDRSPSCP